MSSRLISRTKRLNYCYDIKVEVSEMGGGCRTFVIGEQCIQKFSRKK